MDPKNRQQTDRHDTADATGEKDLPSSWDEIMEAAEKAAAEGHGTVPLRAMNRGWHAPDNTEFFEFIRWRWNVDRAREIVGDRDPRVHIDVIEAYRRLQPDLEMIDRDRAMSDAVDLGEPLIGLVLRMRDQESNVIHESLVVIEGWERVYRAHHEGIDALLVRMLTPEEEREIRLEGLWDLLDQ